MARAGSRNAPGPFNFRGCDLAAECLHAMEEVRVQFPAAAPISDKSRTNSCGRVSKTQPAWGSTRATCHYYRGRGRKVMHLPCKQAQAGALPAVLHHFALRETRPKHREKPHKLLQVGATPTPATNFREVIQLPDCKSGVAKQNWKRRTGALPALPTNLDS